MLQNSKSLGQFGRVFCKKTSVAVVDFKLNIIKWKLHFVSCNFGLKLLFYRRSPDIILLQTLQIVLSALPHGSHPQIAYVLLNTSFGNITVLYDEILLNINQVNG